jgi:hypothetical protein
MNWRGKPLVSHEVVVGGALSIQAEPDTDEYQKGKKVSDEEIKNINIRLDFVVNGTIKSSPNVQLNFRQFLSRT